VDAEREGSAGDGEVPAPAVAEVLDRAAARAERLSRSSVDAIAAEREERVAELAARTRPR
jgi:hypothetical protein